MQHAAINASSAMLAAPAEPMPGERATAALGARLLPSELHQHDVEDRREEQAEERHADHAGEHRDAHRLAHLGAGAGAR